MSRTSLDLAGEPDPGADEGSASRLASEPSPDYARAVTGIVSILDKANRRYRRLFAKASRRKARLEAQLDKIRSLVAEQHVAAGHRTDAGSSTAHRSLITVWTQPLLP